MEKILLAIDAVNLDREALDFACYVANLTGSQVTGVFLENFVEHQQPVIKKMYGTSYLDWDIDKDSTDFKDKQKITEDNIRLFKQACDNRSVRSRVHRDRGVPSDELIAESRFADLIIVDAATSFNRQFEGTPTEFVKDLLKKSECPVIIAPESFEGIDELIFTYNGTASAAFAIKQFTYLFPALDDKKVTVLQVNKSGKWEDIEKHNLKEWLQNHYSSIGFEAVTGDIDDKLFDYLFKRKNIFVVMGAYGRASLSRVFRKSEADFVIKIVNQPIFITHY